MGHRRPVGDGKAGTREGDSKLADVVAETAQGMQVDASGGRG